MRQGTSLSYIPTSNVVSLEWFFFAVLVDLLILKHKGATGNERAGELSNT